MNPNDAAQGNAATRRDELIARAQAFSSRMRSRMADSGHHQETSSPSKPSVPPMGRRASTLDLSASKESFELRGEVARLLKDNEELRGEREGLLDRIKDAEDEVDKARNLSRRKASRATEFRQQFELMKDETWMDEQEQVDLRSLFSQLDTDQSDVLEESEREEHAAMLNSFMSRFNLTADTFEDIGDVSFNHFKAHVEREIRNSMQAKILTDLRIHRAIARVLPGGNRAEPLGGIRKMTSDERKHWLMKEVAEAIDALLVEEMGLEDAVKEM